jgi:hypothetical protein
MAATMGQHPDFKGEDEASTLVSVTRKDTFDTTTTSAAGDEKILSPNVERDSEKEVVMPTDDTDKQAVLREDDTEKMVVPPYQSAEGDTDKIFVPQAPPMSMEKEVAAPMQGELQSVTTTKAPDTFPLLDRSTTSGQPRRLHAGFRFEKKNSLGLIIPENQKIACRMVDLNNGQIGPAAFVTSSMSWTDVAMVLPPFFELHVPGGQVMAARFIPGGFQGLVSMKGEIECIQAGTGGLLEKWTMKRKGLIVGGRQYDLLRTEAKEGVGAAFTWKGSTRVVKEVYSATGAKESVKHGSLKLVTADAAGEVLAVWNQWRDSEVLGDLMIFDAAVGRLSVEVVVTTAIAVVHAERATGMNWIGGLGK